MVMRERNSNIELLRIIAMLLIVMHHFSVHGLGKELPYCLNRYIAGTTILGGKFGVAIFVLISGYYMCRSRFTVKKLLKIWGQVAFYSLSIFTAFFLMNRGGMQHTTAGRYYHQPAVICRSPAANWSQQVLVCH